jgi:hypothetical protein
MEGSAGHLRVDQAEGIPELQEAEVEAATMGFSHRNKNDRGNALMEELAGTKGVPRGPAAQWRLVQDLYVQSVEATRYVRIRRELN